MPSSYLGPLKGKKWAGFCRNRGKPFWHMTVKPLSGHCEILGIVLWNFFHSTLWEIKTMLVFGTMCLKKITYTRMTSILQFYILPIPLSAWWWRCILIFHGTSDLDPDNQSTVICKHLRKRNKNKQKNSLTVCWVEGQSLWFQDHKNTIWNLKLFWLSDTPEAMPRLEWWKYHGLCFCWHKLQLALIFKCTTYVQADILATHTRLVVFVCAACYPPQHKYSLYRSKF